MELLRNQEELRVQHKPPGPQAFPRVVLGNWLLVDTIINCEYFFPGLTALRSDEVIDLMIKEYPGKHAEYSVILQERERQRITEEYSVSTLSSENITMLVLCSEYR